MNQHFSLTLGKRILVSTQDPLMLGTDSEPQPDLMLLKPRDDFYAGAHPQAGDVLLLIEVADSTVRFDREIKLPLYARHGINEVWLFDLEAGQCEVCRDPRPALSAYASRQLRGDGQLAPMALPECVLTLDPLFGR